MQVRGVQVLPEAGGDLVADPVGRLRVQDHLRVAGSPRSEVHDHRLVRTGGLRIGSRVGGGSDQRVPVEPVSGGAFVPDTDRMPQRRTRLACLVHLDRPVGVGDRRDRLGLADPVGDVPRGQQRRPGHRDRAQPDAAQQGKMPIGDPREHHEHGVALADAEGRERVRDTVRGASQVGERQPRLDRPVRAGREEREPPRGHARPNVDHVACVVESRGHVETEGLSRPVVVRHVRRHGHREASSGATEATLGRQPPPAGGRRSRTRRAGRARHPEGLGDGEGEVDGEGDACAPRSCAISCCACAVAACAAAISVWYLARSPARRAASAAAKCCAA